MNLLVVDDHPLARVGLKAALAYEEHISNIWEAANVSEALKQMYIHKPDVALVDLNLGKECGLDFINVAMKKRYTCRYIVLTSSSRREDFVRAKDSGVHGFVLKDALIEDIAYTIRAVARGKRVFDPTVSEGAAKARTFHELTLREREVLLQIGKGLSNLEIAKRLVISEYTVKKHISNIFAKLGLKHRTEAALFVNSALGEDTVINHISCAWDSSQI